MRSSTGSFRAHASSSGLPGSLSGSALATSATAAPEETAAAVAVGHLYTLLLACSSLSPTDPQVRGLAGRFAAVVRPLLDGIEGDAMHLVLSGGAVHCNGRLVRPDSALADRVRWLDEFAAQRRLGVVSIARDVQDADVASVIVSLFQNPRLPGPLQTSTFQVRPPAIDDEHDELLGHLAYASRFPLLSFYAEAIGVIAELEDVARPTPTQARERSRVAARIIDACGRDPSGMLGLVTLRPLPATAANRRLDAAIILAGMAFALQFDRRHTLELVDAALSRRFPGGENTWWTRDPGDPGRAAVRAMEQTTTLERLVTFEAAAPVGLSIPQSYYGREVQPHVCTLLMHVAHGYVDLLQPGESSNPFSPETALQLMFSQTGGFFDPHAVSALASALGLWPPGTIVRLNSGDVAVVVHRPRPGASPHRPFLRPVELSGGSAIYDLSRPELAAYEIVSSAQRSDCAVNPTFVFLQ